MQNKFSDFTKEQTIEQLQKAKTEFQEFAYIVSHDLQAPLRAIVNFSQLLQERYQGTFDEKGNKHFKYVIDGAEQMQKMVDGLLLYSRISTNREEFQQESLSDIIGKVHVDLKDIISKSEASLKIVNQMPKVYCNAKQIADVFYAIINNAIKFQLAGKKPEIWINTKIQEDGSCLVSIKDNGIGIEQNNFLDVFKIFRQLNKPAEYKGLGIGLALAKKIIENHQGNIWIESEVGKGSTFFFTIAGGKYV